MCMTENLFTSTIQFDMFIRTSVFKCVYIILFIVSCYGLLFCLYIRTCNDGMWIRAISADCVGMSWLCFDHCHVCTLLLCSGLICTNCQ